MTRATLDRIGALSRRAASTILATRGATGSAERKADGSPVTAADRASHHIISAGLEELGLGLPVVSEESDAPPDDARRDWRRFWLVDPLDGTKEFVAGRPDYTVNIALIEDGVPVLGAVLAPATDTLYIAGRGLGAWRQRGAGTPTRIQSHPPEAGAPLRIVESRSHGAPALEGYLSRLKVRERVAMGSSLKFCMVAEGSADLYPRLSPAMEWDVAAGDCVFRWSSPTDEPHFSPLRYNQPGLRVRGFVIGFAPPPPAVVWFTGLSGAGKTTIAREVCERLRRLGARVELLDGDAIRSVFPGTGFSRAERDAHIRRVGFLASRLEHHGVTAVASLVSPYRESRDFVRSLCERFVEVHVSTPLAECERRDPKGLYKRARAGEIARFTGIDDPYEPPESPEITLDTPSLTVGDAAGRVLDHLVDPFAAEKSAGRY